MQNRGVVTKICLIVFALTAGWLTGVAQTPTPASAAASTDPSAGASVSNGAAAVNPPSASQVAPNKDQEEEGTTKKKWHVHLGGVAVSASYVHIPSNYFAYPVFPYNFGYAPFFYDPFLPFGPSLAYATDKGKVELAVNQKNAEVYIDDAYAGLAGRLKNMWLEPGAYNFTIASADGSAFHQRIYVLTGKSVKIKAKLVQENKERTPQEKQP
jgi:hypothetical protein